MSIVITTSKAPAAIGPYCQGRVVGDLVFTSGQIPVDPEDASIAQDIEGQAAQSCKNVGAILEAAGSDFSKFNAVYEKFFISNPARSCVAVKTLPKGVLCEIEAIAER